MSSDLALRIDGLGKAYVVRHRTHDHTTLSQAALERLKHPLRRAERDEFWALRNVGFEVEQGQVVGVLGRNGAGKSTLLKLITRITAPTEGQVELWGRVGSLLEVGTGFHPELTGRENVFLNGSILGMNRREIRRQFDAIVAFAGVERFLDTPVKRYSSGMYVRLAFAVAAHLETEILLLDEVLAVGDAEFQKRCLEKVSGLAHDGRTVLLVSHNMATMLAIADRGLLLSGSDTAVYGPIDDVVEAYRRGVGRESSSAIDADRIQREHVDLGTAVRITKINVDHPGSVVRPGEDLRYQIVVRSADAIAGLRIGQTITSTRGETVGTTFSDAVVDLPGDCRTELSVRIRDHHLAPGRYVMSTSIGYGDEFAQVVDLDHLERIIEFEVVGDVDDTAPPMAWSQWWGAVRFPRAVVTVDPSIGRPTST